MRWVLTVSRQESFCPDGVIKAGYAGLDEGCMLTSAGAGS